jgi:hypothetical protein
VSHFTRLRTKLVERRFLLAALDDLGLSHEEGDVAVRGLGGSTTQAQIRVPTSDPRFDIGFVASANGGAYEVVADWWGVKDWTQDELVASLTRRYAYHAARESLEREGFGLVTEEVQADGRIHLVLRRMA